MKDTGFLDSGVKTGSGMNLDGSIYDYIVLGAGPAGLQMGYYLQKSGLNFLILEKGPSAATTFRKFPRRRNLISINKVHNGTTDPELNMRMDWNSLLTEKGEHLFTSYTDEYFPSADVLVQYLQDFANEIDDQIIYNCNIQSIDRNELGHFVLQRDDERIFCKRLIVATGVSKPYMPEIEGIELADNYATMTLEKSHYANKRVLIVGKGNSAFEIAEHLTDSASVIHIAGPKSIQFAWKSHYVGDLRAVNNNFLDTYQLKSQNAILDANVHSIKRNESKNDLEVEISFVRANDKMKNLHYDHVLFCTGFQFDNSLFTEACKPELSANQKYPKQKVSWESTNVSDLYFAGTLMHIRDYKKSATGFIHGFRYAVRSLYKNLLIRYEGRQREYRLLEPRQNTEIVMKADLVAGAILDRVNRSSMLWQQQSFMCDVVHLGSEHPQYIEELVLEDIHSEGLEYYLAITLEYGQQDPGVDPFNVEVGRITQQEVDDASMGEYLHPVVRFYRKADLISEHHITENLENEWVDPDVHIRPLLVYVEQCFEKIRWFGQSVHGVDHASVAP